MNSTDNNYSIYCDESCHLQFENSAVMCIGAIITPDKYIEEYKDEIKHIKYKFGIRHELKWNTVSRTHLEMYDELLNLFFESQMLFRGILVKSAANVQTPSMCQLEFNSLYYSILERLIVLSGSESAHEKNAYRVFLDLKDTRVKNKLALIEKEIAFKIGGKDTILSIQNIRSYESQFIQLVDIIIGAITYSVRGLNGSEAKMHIVKTIEGLSGFKLNQEMKSRDSKFTLYDYNL